MAIAAPRWVLLRTNTMTRTSLNDEELKTLREVVEELTAIRHRVDGVARRLATIPALRPAGVRGAGVIIADLTELEQTIWDAHPDLAPPAFYPPSHLDLEDEIARFSNPDATIRASAKLAIERHLPPNLREQFRETESDTERVALATQWWSIQQKPVIAMEILYEHLTDRRRWRRYAAAQVLSQNGVPDLWPADSSDVDPAAVQRWYQTATKAD